MINTEDELRKDVSALGELGDRMRSAAEDFDRLERNVYRYIDEMRRQEMKKEAHKLMQRLITVGTLLKNDSQVHGKACLCENCTEWNKLTHAPAPMVKVGRKEEG